MASDMFLKIADIKGESKDAAHPDEIEVLSWSWGMSNPASHSGTGLGAGKVSVSDFNFLKTVDAASNALLLKCAMGTHIPNATLVVRKAGEGQKEYLKVTLDDVLVSSVQASAGGGDQVTESVSLAFAKVKFEYAAQKKDGSMEPFKPMGWDLVKTAKF